MSRDGTERPLHHDLRGAVVGRATAALEEVMELVDRLTAER